MWGCLWTVSGNQLVQCVAARLLIGPSHRDHITPLLQQLHWLPFWAEVKVLVLTHALMPYMWFCRRLLVDYCWKKKLNSSIMLNPSRMLGYVGLGPDPAVFFCSYEGGRRHLPYFLLLKCWLKPWSYFITCKEFFALSPHSPPCIALPGTRSKQTHEWSFCCFLHMVSLSFCHRAFKMLNI